MYAEFWIPRTLRCPYPVVMIHGNWQTGTNFTGTPDGREGWAQYFLRRGYAVYVVDQVARGRSPHFSMSQGAVSVGRPRPHRAALHRAQELRPVAAGEAPHPVAGQRQGRRQIFRRVLRDAISRRWSTARSQQEINRDAAAALLDKIGPAIVLTHSQSGAYGWLIADARPKLVKALISIEPNGPPVYESVVQGPAGLVRGHRARARPTASASCR